MLQNEMESLLIDVDQRTKHIDERVTAIDTRVTAIEERVTNIDARTSRIEHILPTLATKDDLRDGLEVNWQRTKALVEEVGDKVQLVAEHVSRLYSHLNKNRT